MGANNAPSPWVVQRERNLFSQAQALTLTPLCFDKLALLNAQSNNSSCGEEPADVERGGVEGKKIKKKLGVGTIDKQSRRCDLFTAVCYVEARARRRKAL